VRNNGSNVEVVIDTDPDEFVEKLRASLSPLARIDDVRYEEYAGELGEFRILKSSSGERDSPIPADTATCQDCLKEMFDPADRRYLFPFTNCTNCGARYTVIQDVPYDREKTTMAPFGMEPKCRAEYENPLDRRFHAQTVACPEDGPRYWLYDKDGKAVETAQPIKDFAGKIAEGALGVMKSWGGTHLVARLPELERFRTWYKRPQKPFAVMARDIEAARKLAELSEREIEILTSPQRPICLVRKRDDMRDVLDLAAPGLDTVGLFLPYTASQHVFFHHYPHDAVLMTSANRPGVPMALELEGAKVLEADCYLMHDRVIANRADDSVVIPRPKGVYFIRKSRGYIPDPFPAGHEHNVVAVGAEMNVVASVCRNGVHYTTPYIGNARNYDVSQFLSQATRHVMDLLGQKELDAVVCDKHPQYATRRFAKELREEYGCRLFDVQHHHAHAASLMLEHSVADDVVCLAVDGTGFGPPDQIWGGEVMITSFDGFIRVGYLEPLPLPGGDRAAEDPRRMAFAIYDGLGLEPPFFVGKEAELMRKLAAKGPMSSSMGRVLDAVSAILGICTQRTYDGEPAMKLEPYLARGSKAYDFTCGTKGGGIQTTELFGQLIEHVKSDLDERKKADLARSFVEALLTEMFEAARMTAEARGIGTLGWTGGVSYNLPMTEIIEGLAKDAGLELLTHRRVPNGDGGISTGQAAIAGATLTAEGH